MNCKQGQLVTSDSECLLIDVLYFFGFRFRNMYFFSSFFFLFLFRQFQPKQNNNSTISFTVFLVVVCFPTADANKSDDGWHFVIDKFNSNLSGFVPRDYLIPVEGLNNQQNPQQHQHQTVDAFSVLTSGNPSSIPIEQIRAAAPSSSSSSPSFQSPTNNRAAAAAASPAPAPPAPNSVYAAKQAPLPSSSNYGTTSTAPPPTTTSTISPGTRMQQREERSPTKMTGACTFFFFIFFSPFHNVLLVL